MKKYETINEIISYLTKKDKTAFKDPRYLVDGSQNVLINDGEKVQIRGGYSILGTTNSDNNTIESAYDWKTSTGTVLNLRSWDDELEVYVGTVDGVAVNAWKRIKDSWSAVDFNYTTWWDTGEELDILCFVNGGDQIHLWSGAMATIASTTANTITKNGTTTWAQNRFISTAAYSKTLIINGTTYTYTGGETTTTLTGVTPDPSGEAADSLAIQACDYHDNQPADGVQNDIISTLNNQLYIASLINNEVAVSKTTTITDYTYSSPRVPGEGALLTLDSPPRAFVRQEGEMYISAGREDWYKTKFNQLEINSALTETLEVEKLKTGIESGAQSQDLCAELGDYICFLDFNNQLRLLGRVEDIENPYMPVISDPIKPDFDDADFTNGQIKPHKNRIYISAPNDGEIYINETTQDPKTGEMRRFWQPPQIIPISKFMIKDGDIHGHSYLTSETYKLFDGTDDNDKSFKAIATYAYRDYGDKTNLKVFDEFVVEGYISSNADLTLRLYYDYTGYTQILEKTIEGDDDDILFETVQGGALGDTPIGDAPIGDQEDEALGNPKFKVIFDIPAQDFHELQVEFETDSQDAYWEIISQGANIKKSPNLPINLHK